MCVCVCVCVCSWAYCYFLRVDFSDVKEHFLVALHAVELWTVGFISLVGQGEGGRGGGGN